MRIAQLRNYIKEDHHGSVIIIIIYLEMLTTNRPIFAILRRASAAVQDVICSARSQSPDPFFKPEEMLEESVPRLIFPPVVRTLLSRSIRFSPAAAPAQEARSEVAEAFRGDSASVIQRAG